MTPSEAGQGPLSGVRILEIGGIGPAPFAGMLLSDMGADVIRVDRAGPIAMAATPADPTMRGRRLVAADLKSPDDLEYVLELAGEADALIEGFRPGTMERLGLGPDVLLERNPRLVYGRITGYGQDGPMAHVAGHDINYISVAGALGQIQRQGERPMFPLNYLGDYGGGAMFLVVGLLAGIIEARSSGKGQVVDAAMVDGVALLGALFHGFRANGMWGKPGQNLLDSGAHFYEVYATADGGHVAVGALEPQFYARLLELLEIPAEEMPQGEVKRWPEFKERMTAIFASKATAEWGVLLDHEEACATVVREPFADPPDPHMAAREVFIDVDGVRQPAPAPRFDRTPSAARTREVAERPRFG